MVMEKKIKMIVTDLDRSLLNSERQISEYTKRVFQECINIGFIVVFATARPMRATKIFFNSIKPNAIICNSGTIVSINDKQVFESSIGQNHVKEILQKIIENYPQSKLAIESNDEVYTNFNPSIYWGEIAYKTLDIENLPKTNIEKIIVGLESFKNTDDIKKYLHRDLYLEISEGLIGIIMNKNASKWNGIKRLLEYYKIKKDNVIAFGDDYNDLEMVKNCGIGIAMENGINEVKNVAKGICGKNNEDGIAKWIKENILEKEQTNT